MKIGNLGKFCLQLFINFKAALLMQQCSNASHERAAGVLLVVLWNECLHAVEFIIEIFFSWCEANFLQSSYSHLTHSTSFAH